MLGLGAALCAAGVAAALLAPEEPSLVRVAPGASESAPRLRYVRSLPEPGDAPLERPAGVTAGGGRVYVADSAAGVVRVFDTGGSDRGVLGEGALAVPVYVAYDPSSGTVLVSDRQLGQVLRFARDGTSLGEVRPSGEETAAWEPLGIDVDGRGRVAVADAAGAQRVVVLTEDGAVERVIGGGRTDANDRVGVALDYPNTVLLTSDALYVGDSNNRRLLVFGVDGAFERLVRLEGVPRGLATIPGEDGAEDAVAVADTLGSEIVLIDGGGGELARYGGPGAGYGTLAYPNDVAWDIETAALYVADTGNARVQVWEARPAGEDRATGPVPGLPLAAAQLGGIILAVIGVVIAVAVVWRPRPAELPEGSTLDG